MTWARALRNELSDKDTRNLETRNNMIRIIFKFHVFDVYISRGTSVLFEGIKIRHPRKLRPASGKTKTTAHDDGILLSDRFTYIFRRRMEEAVECLITLSFWWKLRIKDLHHSKPLLYKDTHSYTR